MGKHRQASLVLHLHLTQGMRSEQYPSSMWWRAHAPFFFPTLQRGRRRLCGDYQYLSLPNHNGAHMTRVVEDQLSLLGMTMGSSETRFVRVVSRL